MNAQNQIQTFQFQLNQSVRVEIKDGEPYFCLSDVAEILEIKNPNQTRFSLKEAGVHKMYTSHESGKKLTTFINEPNLYRVIFRSNKQEAVKFQDWIFEKVIPQIRKTGSYSIQEQAALPTPRYPALTEQDKKDLPAPLGAYAVKLAGWLAKSKGVPQSQIEQQAVEQCSEYRDKAFIHQPKHFFNRAAAWLHQELDKLPVVDFGVCRNDLLNIFKRQCAYKQDFENWNDYQLKSWLDERFFRNRQGGFVGYPTSLESASYKQLEKLVDEMKRELGKDFKLLDLSQQPKQAAALPKLCTSDGSIGQVLFDYGAKNPRGGDVALALQDMALLRSTFDHLTYVNYDSDRLNKKEMAQVAEAGKVLNGLSVMLMEAASETLKH